MLDERPPVLTDLDDPPAIPVRSVVGRWRLAARLAHREIRRRPWRTLLVVLLVAVPVAALTVADTAYRSDHLSMDDRQFGRFAERLDLSGVPADFTTDDVARQLPGVEPVETGFSFFAPLRNEARSDQVVSAQIITFDTSTSAAEGMLRLIDGRTPSGDDEVLLAPSVADQFGVDRGDTFTLARPHQTFHVVGIGTLGWAPQTFLAPGFDVSVVRDDARGAVAFVGSIERREQDVDAVGRMIDGSDLALGGYGLDPRGTNANTTDPIDLFLGWLGSAMVMGVLGIIVAAAFAVSGRRQLVTVGQLSAAGTDPPVIRRFLALQGTWTGLLGALVGLVVGGVFVSATGELVRNDGRADVRAFDWALIAVTAVVVATVAAIVPSRSLSNTSVLAALAGRRPVARVRAAQVRLGAMLLGGGLVALFLAVVSAREANNESGSLQGPAVIAIAAGFAVLAGTCCICPAFVRAIGAVASSAGGSVRLATRSLDRHRARAAAVIAAIAAIGAAVVAMGAVGEQKQLDDQRITSAFGPATVEIRADTVRGDTLAPADVSPALRSEVEHVIGRSEWVQSYAVDGSALASAQSGAPGEALLADPDVLGIYGFSAATRAQVSDADVVWVSATSSGGEPSPSEIASRLDLLHVEPSDVLVIGSSSPEWFGDRLFLSPSFVEAHHLTRRPSTLFVRASHALSNEETTALVGLTTYDYEAAVFADLEQPNTYVSVNPPYRVHGWRALYSWGLAVGALVLVLMVVSLGMALWAAEGRDEREALVTLGAPPSTLAATTGLKAWILATAGGIIAVPLGFGTLRLCIAAARRHTQFPWLIASVVLFVVPAIVGVVTWMGSRFAQRLRPLRMSTSAFE